MRRFETSPDGYENVRAIFFTDGKWILSELATAFDRVSHYKRSFGIRGHEATQGQGDLVSEKDAAKQCQALLQAYIDCGPGSSAVD